MFQKIMIIGSPGAGKSTFARRLHEITHLPLYYLDMIWHKPDKTNISKEEFDERLKEIIIRDKWIIDGNYSRTIELRMNACDTLFLLDFPTEVCLAGAMDRVGKQREDLPWLEDELDEEFRRYIIDFRSTKIPEIYGLIEKYSAQKNIVVFKTRREADDYLMIIKNHFMN